MTDRETNTLAAPGLEELRVNLLLKENSYVNNIILHRSYTRCAWAGGTDSQFVVKREFIHE